MTNYYIDRLREEFATKAPDLYNYIHNHERVDPFIFFDFDVFHSNHSVILPVKQEAYNQGFLWNAPAKNPEDTFPVLTYHTTVAPFGLQQAHLRISTRLLPSTVPAEITAKLLRTTVAVYDFCKEQNWLRSPRQTSAHPLGIVLDKTP